MSDTPRPGADGAPSVDFRSDSGEVFAHGQLRQGMAGGGGLRWAVADLSEIVETLRARRDLSPVAAAALGRTLAGSALLLRLATKTPTRLVLELAGDGPLGRVVAEADHHGNLRGMVGNPRVAVPDYEGGKLAVGTAVGRGQLRVLREHPSGSYHSQVDLVSGEVGEDVTHYLVQSEQTHSAVLLGVLGRNDPPGIAAAGGLIVEVLPGASDDVLDRLEANVAAIPGVSWLMEEGGLDHVLETVLAGLGPEVREARDLYYRCRCDRDRLLRHLSVMSEEDRQYLQEEGEVLEAECVFCGTTYTFAEDELEGAAGGA